METYLTEVAKEDEMVRIRAESFELICMGFQHGNLEMPNYVVPLSKAIERMEEFCREVTEQWKMDGRMVYFRVYACKDDFHLFSYMDGEISDDHRKEERPQSPEKVSVQLMNGGDNPPKRIGGEKRVYAEWAEREMEAMLAEVIGEIEEYRKVAGWENLSPENFFFDVYGTGTEWGYRYSYKNGKTYRRPLNEKERRGDE